MLAADFGDNSVMRELLLAKSVLANAVGYLQAEISKYDEELIEKQTQSNDLPILTVGGPSSVVFWYYTTKFT